MLILEMKLIVYGRQVLCLFLKVIQDWIPAADLTLLSVNENEKVPMVDQSRNIGNGTYYVYCNVIGESIYFAAEDSFTKVYSY